jgi:hypothetical protein
MVMNLNDVMRIASAAYEPDEPDLFAGYWDFEKGEPRRDPDGHVVREAVDGRGDGLVRFLVVELMETWDADGDADEDQIEQTLNAVDRAQEQVAAIHAAIFAKYYGPSEVEDVGEMIHGSH